MRYGVNARLLLEGKLEGIGWFSYETLKRIVLDHPEHEFVFFFDRPFNQKFIFSSNVKGVVLFPPARHPILYFLFFEISLAWALRKYKCDVLISPDGFIPVFSKLKSISVIHDINFEHRPKDFSILNRWYNIFFFRRFAKKATAIATVSEFSKADLIACYGTSAKKITVVYNGSNEKYVPLSIAEQVNTRIEFSNGLEYFLYVGSLNPRKNIVGLLQAFDLFKKDTASTMKLILVGKVMHGSTFFKETLSNMQFRDDVLFTGHLDVEALHRLIASAFALSYVPYFEGFGIPVLEALNCDTPVITSNVTSLPEVAGEAALYINPQHPEEIAAAMKQLLVDPHLRTNLIVNGREQKKKFSWNQTAKKLWEVIERVSHE